MSQPPAPTDHPAHRRRWVLVLCIPFLYGFFFGVKHVREEHVYRPVCDQVCGARKMRYEGYEQARKSDHAVACRCVGAGFERKTVPANFYSDNWLLEGLATILTSSMTLLFIVMVLGVSGYVFVTRRVLGKKA